MCDLSLIFIRTADAGRLTQMNADEECDRTFESIPFGVVSLHALFPQPLQNPRPRARNTIAQITAYNLN